MTTRGRSDMTTPIPFRSTVAALLALLAASPAPAGEALLTTSTLNGHVPIRSWKAIRDNRVVKQDLDYSCGAASLATVLREFYGVEVTEQAIIDRMEKDGAASFADLAEVAKTYGFDARGVALSFDKLRTLKIPAIAYLHHRGDDHFSVIRGIGQDGRVWLGDPSWGNRQFSRHRFLQMWETRDDPVLKGKILLVVPKEMTGTKPDSSFFHPPPRREALAVQMLTRPAASTRPFLQ